MNTSNRLVSIVIPVYNEEKNLRRTIESINDYLSGKNFESEVIFVEDGSGDDSPAIIKSGLSLFKNGRIIENGKNLGKGESVKRGVLSARGGNVLFMDADSSVSIDYLDEFLPCLVEADIVVASIMMKGGRVETDENHSLRRLFGLLAKYLIKLVVPTGVSDTQRGFKLFSRKAAEIVFPRQRISRWGFDIELLAIAKRHKLEIKELPVVWNNPKSSSVTLVSYFQTLFELFLIKKNLLLGRYD